MNTNAIRAAVLDFLADRQVKNDETVQYGWFIFRTVVEPDRFDLQTLDFKRMASFTSDFRKVEDVHAQQQMVLASENVEAEWCVLWHSALLSRSYYPGHPNPVMIRMDLLEGNASGWYIGVLDDPIDVNDPENLHLQSLYELTINDQRFAPYWLLPVRYQIEFEGTDCVKLHP